MIKIIIFIFSMLLTSKIYSQTNYSSLLISDEILNFGDTTGVFELIKHFDNVIKKSNVLENEKKVLSKKIVLKLSESYTYLNIPSEFLDTNIKKQKVVDLYTINDHENLKTFKKHKVIFDFEGNTIATDSIIKELKSDLGYSIIDSNNLRINVNPDLDSNILLNLNPKIPNFLFYIELWKYLKDGSVRVELIGYSSFIFSYNKTSFEKVKSQNGYIIFWKKYL